MPLPAQKVCYSHLCDWFLSDYIGPAASDCKYFWLRNFFSHLILELAHFFSTRKYVGPGITIMFISLSYSTCSHFSASMLFISMRLLLCFILLTVWLQKVCHVLVIWARNLTSSYLLLFLGSKSTFWSSYSLSYLQWLFSTFRKCAIYLLVLYTWWNAHTCL